MRIYSLIFIIFVTGCTSSLTYKDVEYFSSKIDIADGVDGWEARVLAQKFIIEKGLASQMRSLKPYKVKKREVWRRNGEIVDFVIPPDYESGAFTKSEYWEVYFKDKRHTALFGLLPYKPFYVIVDVQQGDIINWGLKS